MNICEKQEGDRASSGQTYQLGPSLQGVQTFSEVASDYHDVAVLVVKDRGHQKVVAEFPPYMTHQYRIKNGCRFEEPPCLQNQPSL